MNENLTSVVAAFLAHKRALGRKYQSEEATLRLLVGFAGDHGVELVDQLHAELLDAFFASRPRPRPRSFNQLVGIVGCFLDWAVAQQLLAVSPLRTTRRRETANYILDGAAIVARHPRGLKGDEVLVLDHYLEVLAIKTGAFPGATALARARSAGTFSPAHERFWTQARRRLGDRDGTRALIEVLLLHRSIPADALVAGIERALTAGSVDPAVIAIEARRIGEEPVAAVIPIGEGLSRFDRPVPSTAHYDTLLEAQ